MGEERQQITRKWPNYRRREPEPKAEFPVVPYPEGALTPKYLGYLHCHLKIPIWEIVASYPSKLTTALVHLGIYHYLKNQAALDAELTSEGKFNRGNSLVGSSMSLPPVGLSSLVQAEEAFQAMSEAERRKR